jgi:hypothetical protein
VSADEVHVAAYSPVQKCWHVESLADHVTSNARNLGAGTLGDTAYCAVALAESHEAACDAIDKIKGTLNTEKEAGDDENGTR